MFDFDDIREILSTMRKNRLRTFLTGFSVAWGIFILIILLAAGNGLRNGVMYNFSNFSANRIEVWPNYTSKPWQGIRENRRLTFRNADVEHLGTDFPEVEYYSGRIDHSDTLAYNKEYVNGNLSGVAPDFASIDFIIPTRGRFINEIDMQQRRKAIVLSPRMAEVLFHEEDPIGRYVRIGRMMFQVVGVYRDKEMNNNKPAYIPFTTAQQLFRSGMEVDDLIFTVRGIKSEEENTAFEHRFRTAMALRHHFDPSDTGALGMWNTGDDFRMFDLILSGLMMFIWIVGISTLMAGIVGVSNIMLVTVRERTREFGIRKAIGAGPTSILRLIIIESILVTTLFGYVGMVAGIGVTELIDYGMTMAGMNADTGGGPGNLSIFRHPTVSLGIATSATVLLIIAGVAAGYFPARKAVSIPAVEAMRSE